MNASETRRIVVVVAVVVVVLLLPLGLVFVVGKSPWLLLVLVVHSGWRLVGRASWVEEEQPLHAAHPEEVAAWTALAVREVASWQREVLGEVPADCSATCLPSLPIVDSLLLEGQVASSFVVVVEAVAVAVAGVVVGEDNFQQSAGGGVAHSPNAAESSHLEAVVLGIAAQRFHTFLVDWEGVEIGCSLVEVEAAVGRGSRRIGSFLFEM
mmetsp:Transcript_14114/g.21670  ORF Transcript_14114/g.21670 Transcript_14114/m.21670 type:complete len:210 (+) Transcript_14114:896-1525(+)